MQPTGQTTGLSGGLRLVLVGDGERPEMLRWARAWAPRVQLHVISSRGFAPGWELLVPDACRLALGAGSEHGGLSLALLKPLPKIGAWLAEVDADWLHVHGLTTHGSLAWAAKTGWRLRARILGTEDAADTLAAPQGAALRWMARKVVRSCALLTTDSAAAQARLQAQGAREVLLLDGRAPQWANQVQVVLSRLHHLSAA